MTTNGEQTQPKYAPLVCPVCQSDNLGTTEEISGVACCHAYVEVASGQRLIEHDGWTDVCWDSSTTIGMECRDCQWHSKSANWLIELVLANPFDAQMELGDASA